LCHFDEIDEVALTVYETFFNGFNRVLREKFVLYNIVVEVVSKIVSAG